MVADRRRLSVSTRSLLPWNMSGYSVYGMRRECSAKPYEGTPFQRKYRASVAPPVRRGMITAELGLDERADVFETDGMLALRDLIELANLRAGAARQAEAGLRAVDQPQRLAGGEREVLLEDGEAQRGRVDWQITGHGSPPSPPPEGQADSLPFS